MPYRSIDELPESVRSVLPVHAREIFKEAFNSAYDEYEEPSERRGNESREEVVFKVAWSAVQHKYEKGEDGNWHSKPE